MLCSYAHVYEVGRHSTSYQLKSPSPKPEAIVAWREHALPMLLSCHKIPQAL